jgi:hypothetical protein
VDADARAGKQKQAAKPLRSKLALLSARRRNHSAAGEAVAAGGDALPAAADDSAEQSWPVEAHERQPDEGAFMPFVC